MLETVFLPLEAPGEKCPTLLEMLDMIIVTLQLFVFHVQQGILAVDFGVSFEWLKRFFGHAVKDGVNLSKLVFDLVPSEARLSVEKFLYLGSLLS